MIANGHIHDLCIAGIANVLCDALTNKVVFGEGSADEDAEEEASILEEVGAEAA